MSARAYRPRTRKPPETGTRERIVAAVGDLLDEGGFHDATVEEIAQRAGVSRATLYQHFGSRLGLVDALCETFGQTGEIRALKAAAELPDVDAALDGFLEGCVRFWASHERRLVPLYGVAAVDDAAARLVQRQDSDRHRVITGLAKRLGGGKRTVALLLLATSFGTYRELRRHAGLTEREVEATLRKVVRGQLGSAAGRSA